MTKGVAFWWRWLVAAIVVVILFGAALVFLPSTMQLLFNVLFFGSTGGQAAFSSATPYLKFVFAVVGSVMVG